MTKSHQFAFTALALTVMLSGAPARAWSPLQYDTEKEIGLPEHSSVRDMFMKLRGKGGDDGMQDPGTATPSDGAPADEQSGASKGTGEKQENEAVEKWSAPGEKEAQSAIEKEAGGAAEDKLPGAEDSKDAGDSKEKQHEADSDEPAKPLPPKASAKPPGKMPTEGVTDPQYFLDRAHSFAVQADYQSALNYVNKALDLRPTFWEAWYEKGLIFQLAGYDGPAARRYLALIERQPDMVQPHVAIGSLYRKHGNFDLAEKEYRKAIDLNFYYFPSHYNLANLFMDQEKYDQALKEYKVCLKLKPNEAMVHNNIGVIFEHRKYLEEAAEEFEKASHLDPANQKFVQNLQAVRDKISHRAPRTVAM